MYNVRPVIPRSPEQALLTRLAGANNSHQIIAGEGIDSYASSEGHVIRLQEHPKPTYMNYDGIYDKDAGYNIDDVVYVPPGSTTSPGTYVCIKNIPPSQADYTFFINSIVPAYSNAGSIASNALANTYRWNQCNNYAPQTSPNTSSFTPTTISGYVIQVSQSFWQILGGSGGLNWMSDYKSSASYAVNDVVRVFPTASSSYVDWDNSPLTIGTTDTFTSSSNCPICAGLFICVQPVPTFDERNDYNIAYPIYPEIPLNLQMTAPVFSEEGTSSLNANIRYWEAMSPMFAAQLCNNQTMYVNGFLSGSNFNMGWLPYTPE